MSKKKKKSIPRKSAPKKKPPAPKKKPINPLKQRKDGKPLSARERAKRIVADSARRSQAARKGWESRRGKLERLRSGIYGTYRDYSVDAIEEVGKPIDYENGKDEKDKLCFCTIIGTDEEGNERHRRTYAFDPREIDVSDLIKLLNQLANGESVGTDESQKKNAIVVDKVIATFREADKS